MKMLGLSLLSQHQFDLFKRQYLQLQAPIKYPDSESLRQEAFQEALFEGIFKDGATSHEPPTRYKLRILKELIAQIEASILDWDEEGISDDLASELSNLLSCPLPSEAAAAQQKTYVTYTLSFLSKTDVPPTITLLEARNLLLGSGTTGFRTWEACLHLSLYLSSLSCTIDLKGKNVLELGSGTGYLSVFCSKYLGVAHMTATDGSNEVIAELATNFYLNGLQDSTAIVAKELKWGQALLGGEQAEWNQGRVVEVILLADVTYDVGTQPALMATVVDLNEMYPKATILISATIRNEKTWENFTQICESQGFSMEEVDFPLEPPAEQAGPFYWDGFPIKLCTLNRQKQNRADDRAK